MEEEPEGPQTPLSSPKAVDGDIVAAPGARRAPATLWVSPQQRQPALRGCPGGRVCLKLTDAY